ncbi:taurine ABC transporter substrate-binding protein [Paenibacillus endoradicis]|uniref:taurine ABC transporter substrate-binding protein n=1 Tax=Paenibacillus endoradicis TaxID=2972487 RepID=UPI002159016E|nr:ABC transporter substrate-binding protein [Paenibacillus endoradicis]MCR8659347.1 ABC transporter substrate-binding protein [Paenibacillus endoradicis]
MKNKKSFFKSITITLIALLLLSACSQGKDSGKDNNGYPKEVTIGYQVIPNAELLVKTLGLAEKKFPDVTIKWVQFDSGRDVNTAIASGSIDFGLAGSVPVSIGVSSKLEYYVYFLHDIIGENEALAIRNDAGIATIQDLVGKKIAVPFGSTAHFSVLSALANAGIAQDQVTVLDLQPPDILAAWQRKDIDAAFVWQPTLAKLVEDNGSLLLSAKDLAAQGAITSDTGIVSKKFADQYPSFVKDYVAVLDEAIELYRTKPEEAATALAPLLSATEEESLAQMNELVWLTSKEQQDEQYLGKGVGSGFGKVLKATGDFLVEQGTIESSPELSDYEKAIYVAGIEQ